MIIERIRKLFGTAEKKGGAKSKKLGPVGLSHYGAAILALASQKERVVVAVVGANDGKIEDPIFDLVKQYIAKSVELILIEPQSFLIDIINENYAFVESKHVFNVAIGDNAALRLYRVKPEYWKNAVSGKKRERPSYSAPTGVTSSQKEHVVRWAAKHVKSDLNISEVIEEFEVTGCRLGQLLTDNHLPSGIDVLQVDAEGEDDTVIYCCDIELTKPTIVFFESMNLTRERLNRLVDYLRGLHYEVFTLEKDTLAIRRYLGTMPGQKPQVGEAASSSAGLGA